MHLSSQGGGSKGKRLRCVISQIIDLACDAAQFPIEVIEPRRHVELDVPQLAGDEAERSFEPRFRSLSSFSKSTAIGEQ